MGDTGPTPPHAGEAATDSVAAWWRVRSRVDAAELLTAGNRQLTSLTGALLLPLLGLIFLTGLAMDAYWHVHYAVGFVLIPVVALKAVSTGYRAISYYGGRTSYRRAGPPEPLLRLLAPLVVGSTLVALVTGVLLWAQHSRGGTLSSLHTDAAVICAVTVGVHVLAYVPRALTASWEAILSVRSRAGTARIVVVVLVLVAGIALAAFTYGSGTWPARVHRSFDDVRGAGWVRPSAPGHTV